MKKVFALGVLGIATNCWGQIPSVDPLPVVVHQPQPQPCDLSEDNARHPYRLSRFRRGEREDSSSRRNQRSGSRKLSSRKERSSSRNERSSSRKERSSSRKERNSRNLRCGTTREHGVGNSYAYGHSFEQR